jgi:hypothetical protein
MARGGIEQVEKPCSGLFGHLQRPFLFYDLLCLLKRSLGDALV